MIVVSVMLSLNEKMCENVVKQPVLSNNEFSISKYHVALIHASRHLLE